MPTFPEGFPEIIDEFEKLIGRKTLGNEVASGTEIIERLGSNTWKRAFPLSIPQQIVFFKLPPMRKLFLLRSSIE